MGTQIISTGNTDRQIKKNRENIFSLRIGTYCVELNVLVKFYLSFNNFKRVRCEKQHVEPTLGFKYTRSKCLNDLVSLFDCAVSIVRDVNMA